MESWSAGLKVFSWVVVALMVVSIVYAAVMSLYHWSGIAV